MENYITAIEELWQTRDTLGKNEEQFAKGKCIIEILFLFLLAIVLLSSIIQHKSAQLNVKSIFKLT